MSLYKGDTTTLVDNKGETLRTSLGFIYLYGIDWNMEQHIFFQTSKTYTWKRYFQGLTAALKWT